MSNIDTSSDKSAFNSLYVSGFSTFQNSSSFLSSLNVSGTSIFENNITMKAKLNISGNSFFNSNITINNNLIVSGVSIFNLNVTINNNLNVSGPSTFQNFVTLNNNLNVTGISTFESDIICNANIIGNNIGRKTCFFFTTPATGELLPTPYNRVVYPYHIDLRKYTKSYTLPNRLMLPLTIIRKFRIMTWPATSNFYAHANSPAIEQLEYSIYMGFKSNTNPPNSIFAFGMGPNITNYYLSSWDGPQVLKPIGDFDYLAYYSTAPSTLVCCVITDDL